MTTKHFFLIPIFVFVSTFGFAGTDWHYECENPNCHIEGDLNINGGFIFDSVTGYCTTCNKFVSISWKTAGVTGDQKKKQDKVKGLLKSAPKKLGTVWNPATGLTADLYACPDCGRPFMVIDSISLIQGSQMGRRDIFCPHCSNATLKIRRIGNFD